jgi:hypothetical protein
MKSQEDPKSGTQRKIRMKMYLFMPVNYLGLYYNYRNIMKNQKGRKTGVHVRTKVILQEWTVTAVLAPRGL